MDCVVFRFHRAPEACRRVLRLVRRLNPGVSIHGLGERIGIADALDTLHVIEGRDAEWHWKDGDLVLCEWFEAVGRELSFDRLHLIEWDLLACAPFDALYGDAGDAVVVSGRIPMAEARERGWAWVTEDGREYTDAYRAVRDHVARTLGHDTAAPACVFPGLSVPRSFLADYADCVARDPPPTGVNDEVRVPLYAQALGYEVADTGFYDWDADGRLFNCLGNEVPVERIERELYDPAGRRVFHPVRSAFDPDRLVRLRT